MHFLRCSVLLIANFINLATAQSSVPSVGNYEMLSVIIDQYPPENDNTTINENFAIIAQGTHDGSLPVECGSVWNVTGPTPQEQLICTDPAVEVIVRQMHTSPEYGFELYIQLK